jgi:FkbM family methyltransferase
MFAIVVDESATPAAEHSRRPHVIRRRMKNAAASALAAAIERRPGLEQFLSSRADRRKLNVSFTRLREAGRHIHTVYDIGAHQGTWTTAVRASLPEAQFVLFEANATHRHELERTGVRFFIATLSSTQQLVDFYAIGGTGDSYYRETTARYAEVRPERVQTTTLDLMVETHRLPPPQLLKVDVQGAELDVLRGGKNTLAGAMLVLLECPVAEYNEGAPKFGDYIEFMEQSGFTPIEFLDPVARSGKVIHLDVLFADLATSRALGF